ncbi:hypothetical protein HS125_16960 [bacterium]|nr:hypothetical protein [bacterium]
MQHFFTGAKHEEIAERMGVTRSAVTRRIARGVEMVRMHLADRGMLVGAAVLASLLPLSAGAQVPPSLAASLGKLAVAGTAGGPLPAAALHTQTPPAQERLAGATLTHSAASSGPGLGAFSSAVLKTAAALALATLLYLGWHALKGSPETAEPLPPAADEYLLQQR